MTVAIARGRLAHEVLMGPIAAQAPIAAGAAVGDGLGRQQTGALDAVGGHSWHCGVSAPPNTPISQRGHHLPGALGEDKVGLGWHPGSGCRVHPSPSHGRLPEKGFI